MIGALIPDGLVVVGVTLPDVISPVLGIKSPSDLKNPPLVEAPPLIGVLAPLGYQYY